MENRRHIILLSPAQVRGSGEDVQPVGLAVTLAEMEAVQVAGVGELRRAL